ncbi:MAG: YdeI/OmpD-associated family protein [Chitinophagaceae bacterium]|nr:YdeI/OmpD-associated family protein [Chitinophagaceae bacterium]
MAAKNPKIDAYINKSAGFAKPILNHLRQLVHKACPQAEEVMKWSFPHFDYKGEMMCSMASFKQHCAFGFWKAALMKDADILIGKESHAAMGNLGKITSLKDLPKDKIITGWIKEAMKLNDDSIKLPKDKPPKYDKKELVVPRYFTDALKKNKKAWATFESFSYSNKKDYTEWVVDAKSEDTRNKRMAQAIEWMAEGKPRNWKYMKEYR